MYCDCKCNFKLIIFILIPLVYNGNILLGGVTLEGIPINVYLNFLLLMHFHVLDLVIYCSEWITNMHFPIVAFTT